MCKLPNGIIIAHDSYFNFANAYLRPNVVVKSNNGTILSRGNDELFIFSETTAHWIDEHHDRNAFLAYEDVSDLPETGLEALIYRPDIGLVSAWDNKVLYEKLKNEMGTLLEEGKVYPDGRQIINSNVLHVLKTLKQDPKYYTLECDITLISFTSAYP